ncbi:hypothetical protein BDV97DRAFT_393838 [Delphinella strobiligena]|nr:hypothetical protein BDV97DRAFT_393838 [Delphinella strobiligena]
MKSYLLFVLPALLQLVCSLDSTGVTIDEAAKAPPNFKIIYISVATLEDDSQSVLPGWANLLGMAKQAFDEMESRCRADTSIWDALPSERLCPGAMTVLAVGDKLYFASSVKSYTTGKLFLNFLFAGNSEDTIGLNALKRLKRAAVQCQLQAMKEKATSHKTGAQCGEFGSIFQYLVSLDNPANVDFTNTRARILTWGRHSVDKDHRDPNLNTPIWLRPCLSDPKLRLYGCIDYLKAFPGIQSASGFDGIPKFVDVQGTVEQISLCQAGHRNNGSRRRS